MKKRIRSIVKRIREQYNRSRDARPTRYPSKWMKKGIEIEQEALEAYQKDK